MRLIDLSETFYLHAVDRKQEPLNDLVLILRIDISEINCHDSVIH